MASIHRIYDQILAELLQKEFAFVQKPITSPPALRTWPYPVPNGRQIRHPVFAAIIASDVRCIIGLAKLRPCLSHDLHIRVVLFQKFNE